MGVLDVLLYYILSKKITFVMQMEENLMHSYSAIINLFLKVFPCPPPNVYTI